MKSNITPELVMRLIPNDWEMSPQELKDRGIRATIERMARVGDVDVVFYSIYERDMDGRKSYGIIGIKNESIVAEPLPRMDEEGTPNNSGDLITFGEALAKFERLARNKKLLGTIAKN